MANDTNSVYVSKVSYELKAILSVTDALYECLKELYNGNEIKDGKELVPSQIKHIFTYFPESIAGLSPVEFKCISWLIGMNNKPFDDVIDKDKEGGIEFIKIHEGRSTQCYYSSTLNGLAKELTFVVSFKATIFARNKDCDFNNIFINDVVGGCSLIKSKCEKTEEMSDSEAVISTKAIADVSYELTRIKHKRNNEMTIVEVPSMVDVFVSCTTAEANGCNNTILHYQKDVFQSAYDVYSNGGNGDFSKDRNIDLLEKLGIGLCTDDIDGYIEEYKSSVSLRDSYSFKDLVDEYFGELNCLDEDDVIIKELYSGNTLTIKGIDNVMKILGFTKV
jgi:hypothetical protein